MGFYTVWVLGPSPFIAVEEYDECNDIPASFPGLSFDFIGEVEEQGPAHYFAAFSDEDLPYAIVTADGQIVRETHPGSEPDPKVSVGRDKMREYLESHPNEAITPMRWHA